MVIKIHQSLNTDRAFYYNENKVEKGQAQLFAFANANCANPFQYNKAYRLGVLEQIEAMNTRAKHKCLHISVNPTKDDLEKLSAKELKEEIHQLMTKLGYEGQPYYVYHHQDINREHFHIVSTRIDRNTGKQINHYGLQVHSL